MLIAACKFKALILIFFLRKEKKNSTPEAGDERESESFITFNHLTFFSRPHFSSRQIFKRFSHTQYDS